jgi:hypothetical protein
MLFFGNRCNFSDSRYVDFGCRLLDGGGVAGLVVTACCASPILVRTGLMAFNMPPLEPRPNLEATLTARKWQAQHDGILRAGMTFN